MGTKEVVAVAYKDTYWNKVRVEKGFKLREVAEYLGIKLGLAGMYFSGQILPPDNTVHKLCEYFDVDYNSGQLAFQHAHRTWVAEHQRKPKVKAEKKADTPKSAQILSESVLDLIYGKVPRKDFQAILGGTVEVTGILELVYGIVDHKTYTQIEKLIQEEK